MSLQKKPYQISQGMRYKMNARCCDVTTRVYPRHDHDRDSGLPDKGSKSSGTRRASWTKRTLRRNACRCGRCYWSRGKRLHVPAIERRDCTGHWIRRRCVKTREALHRAAKNSGMQSCRDNAHAESQQAPPEQRVVWSGNTQLLRSFEVGSSVQERRGRTSRGYEVLETDGGKSKCH